VAERIRIVVAFDTASRVAPLIETGAALAAGLHAMLDALFVEDERLLRLAALPFAHELGFRRAPAVIEAATSSAAAGQIEMRRQLAATAEALELPWQLNVLRGDVLRTAFGYASVATFSCSGGASRGDARKREGSRRRALRPAASPVLTLFDGNPAGGSARGGPGAGKGRDRRARDPDPRSGPRPFRASASRPRHRRPGAPAPSQYVSIPDLAAGTIARTARAQSAAVLIWPGDGREPGVLAGIVDAVPCPVVVVG
jgi:hypothetical protein